MSIIVPKYYLGETKEHPEDIVNTDNQDNYIYV